MSNLEEIIAKMAERSLEQQGQIAGLIEAIKAMPGVQNPVAVTVQPAVIDPAIARADKVQRLSMSMRKTNRIKEFKGNDSDIRIFIKKFEGELATLKPMVGIADNLTDLEYIPIF
ncbi:unnamed protein product, partial [Meganyctiphanes norvegica]